jgi:4-amino-4-deoxy-L-arabinose transferase-like glycosyltransferase
VIDTATAPETQPAVAGSDINQVGRRAQMAWKPVAIITAITGAVHLAVLTRYGWHRDELYYVVSGHHLAFGYPDQPPLAPVVARVAAGAGLAGLRLVAVMAQLGCILLTAALAAELGGRRRAQTIAAAAAAGCPIFVGAALLFGTTVLDQLAWAAVLFLVARALRTGRDRDWLTAGLAAGLGLENKQTVVVLILGVLVGLGVTRRPVLAGRGPWLAGLVAAVFWVPNLAWDATHGWANLRMAASEAAGQGGPLGSAAQLPLLALLLAGPLLIGLWLRGGRWLWRDDAARAHRWLLAVPLVSVVIFTASGGKPYYSAPALLGLFAAGAVAIERFSVGSRLSWRRWPAALGLSMVSAAVIGLPIFPVSVASSLRAVDPEVVETYGWPQFTAEVAAATRNLPSDTVVFTSNYGEAGAFARFGPALGLHLRVASAHNGYGYWGPPSGSDQLVVAVGQWDASYLHRYWDQVTEIAPLRLRGITDKETLGHAAIFLCRAPHGSWAALWPHLRHLD